MSGIKIAIAQCECIDGDTQRNLTKLNEVVHSLDTDTSIVVFPELFIQGFILKSEANELAEKRDGDSLKIIERLAAEHQVTIVVGFAEQAEGAVYNSVAWVTPQGVSMVYRKTHMWLSDRDVFVAGADYPTTYIDDTKVGSLICFDVEFPEPSRMLALLGVDAIFLCNGNMQEYQQVHRLAAQVRAQENQVYVIVCNRVGTGRDEVFAGDSMAIGPTGAILCELGQSEKISYCVIDKQEVINSRLQYNYLEERAIKVEEASGLIGSDSITQIPHCKAG